MTARLTRLRIAGFKSFAEPVSLDILPGLTGIVGPNGCGKSNVVEALRWAMGETSARSLRGGEMDDVIFAGTTARASRNLAEATLTLEAGRSSLPAPFEAESELQVTRRIERGAGSVFRANGRELRARDVQTLYADLSSGARSSGMVSQGRVADLVRARPEERRQVLEEAAGITGLHARRHEAELKLRAAEQNVARAGDLRSQLEGARDGLRRQARQAARYRAVSGLIRAAEAEHLAILCAQADAALHQARTEASEAETEEAARRSQEAAAAEELASAEAALPGLRASASDARSALERRRFEAETLAEAAHRAAQERDAAEARMNELACDLDAATEAERDAQETVQRLSLGIEAQAARLSALPEQAELAAQHTQRTRAAQHAAQTQADEAANRASAAAIAARQVQAVLQATSARLAIMQGQHNALLAEQAACEHARIGEPQLARAEASTTLAEADVRDARASLDAAEIARAEAARTVMSTRASSEREQARLQAAMLDFDSAADRTERLRAVLQAAEDAFRQHRSGRIDAEIVVQAGQAADQAALLLAQADATLDGAEQAASLAWADAASARRLAEDASAARARAQEELSAARSRAARIAADWQAAARAWDAAGNGPDAETCARVAAGYHQAEQVLAARSAEWSEARQANRSAVQALNAARAALAQAEADAARLRAETEGTEAALGDGDGAPDLLDAIEVPAGLELAFGAALGEAADARLDARLDASGNASGRCGWRTLPPMAPGPLPERSVALASLLSAPDALARLLSHAALLDSGADGEAAQSTLAAGMVAVDRTGASWRWDGLVTRADAPNPAAARLGLRRRLAETRARLASALQHAASAQAELAQADGRAASRGLMEASADRARQAAEAEWRQAEQAMHRQQEAAAHTASRKAALQPSIEALRADSETAERAVRAAEQAAGETLDPAALGEAAQAAQAVHAASIQALETARTVRSGARARADEARQAAQTLAGQVPRAEALFEAASEARQRAADELEHAARALSETEAHLAAMQDPAALALALDQAEAAEAGGRAREADARRRRQAAETELDRTRQAAAELRNSHVQTQARHASVSDRVARSQAELDEAERQARLADDAASSMPDGQALAAAAEAAKAGLGAAREAARQAEGATLALAAERALAERVQDEARAELEAWRRRLNEAQSRRDALSDRHQAAQAAWRARAVPEDAAAEAAGLLQVLDTAEQAHRAADAQLQAADEKLRTLSATLRAVSEQARELRERRARLLGRCETREAALCAVLARVAERLGADASLPRAEEYSEQAEERARRRHERLCREREEVGPVNLRAELELAELDQRMAELERECQELDTAIAKLRGSIGHLNREGRERLLAVFTQVDQHFRALFTRMMGGGRAHLAMTGSDDPLAAGLEIYAEPPGKKLSALSLLSGGEQALTALSLIFAVFRCTPAPLCVLDEVDAPLDDANVERFCSLLDDVVRDTGTSFLVVTHHQLTMSRMDRLFGVTMQERGVSRLLSVDLRRAAAMAEPVLQAAE